MKKMKYIVTENGIEEIDHEEKVFSNFENTHIDCYLVKRDWGYSAYYKHEYKDKVAETIEELHNRGF